MISRKDLLAEIEKCQRDPITYTSIDKLASLITVYNHFYGEETPDPRGGYAEKNDVAGDTPFLRSIMRTPSSEAWAVMDELMSVLEVSCPRLYDGVMSRLL